MVVMDARGKRLTLVAVIMGSFVVGVDSTVVNVALPSIARSLGGGLAGEQWVVNAYLLALGSFMLLGGSLGDVLGERRVFTAGVAGFGLMSAICAVSPSIGVLIAARALQGVAGALLTPAALAVIIATFTSEERGAAIGSWMAWSAIATVVGPLAGGELLNLVSWRFVFAINLPFVLVTLALTRRIPAAATRTRRRIDVIGAILAAAGLAGPVFALIEQPRVGWSSAEVFLPALLGVLLLACFVVWESRAPSPMLPLELFRARNFSAGNLETLALYGGLGAFFVYLVVFLQQVAGYSPLRSGLATLPTTVVMFSLSRWFGRLADRFGVRWFMGCGPLVASAGLLMLTGLGQRVSYFADLLPGIVVFSVGLAATVAPLTAGVLSGADPSRGGIASAVNNTLARVGGLLATAAIGAVISAQFSASLHSRLPAHLPPTARQAVAVALRQPLGIPQPGRGANAVVLDLRRAGQGAAVQAFHSGLEIIAGLVFLAGLLGLLGIRDRSTTTRAAECAGGAITDATAHGVPLRSAPAPGAG
jgi:EmrB/QacA subfamily drug resistance transporter